jgi:hypothetical protein
MRGWRLRWHRPEPGGEIGGLQIGTSLVFFTDRQTDRQTDRHTRKYAGLAPEMPCTSLAGEANPQRSGCTTSTRATISVAQNVILPRKETLPPSDNAVIARHNLCCRQWPEPSLNSNNQPIRAPLPH